MNWTQTQPGTPTDPAYYHDAASPREAKLRADFTRFHYLREIAPYGETPTQIAELTGLADALHTQWGRSGSIEHRSLWSQLDAATAVWQARPETTRAEYFRLARAKAAGDLPVDELAWRTLSQAAVITGRIEPGITGSGQDGARSRPQDRALGVQADPANLLDRALGGRGPEIVSLDEVDAIIAATDDLLDAEELHSDLDTGADQRSVARNTALRQVQDLTAEHAHASTHFAGIQNHDQDLIARLDSLLTATREARSAAELSGATPEQIHNAYLAGRDGSYVHDTAYTDRHHAPQRSEVEPAARIDAAVTAAIGGSPGHGPVPELEPAPELDTDMHRELGVAQ